MDESGVGLYEDMQEKLWRLDQLLYLFSLSFNNPSVVFSLCVGGRGVLRLGYNNMPTLDSWMIL
jgi:hypothetical protein